MGKLLNWKINGVKVLTWSKIIFAALGEILILNMRDPVLFFSDTFNMIAIAFCFGYVVLANLKMKNPLAIIGCSLLTYVMAAIFIVIFVLLYFLEPGGGQEKKNVSDEGDYYYSNNQVRSNYTEAQEQQAINQGYQDADDAVRHGKYLNIDGKWV